MTTHHFLRMQTTASEKPVLHHMAQDDSSCTIGICRFKTFQEQNNANPLESGNRFKYSAKKNPTERQTELKEEQMHYHSPKGKQFVIRVS